jgi:methyltransferase-like protein
MFERLQLLNGNDGIRKEYYDLLTARTSLHLLTKWDTEFRIQRNGLFERKPTIDSRCFKCLRVRSYQWNQLKITVLALKLVR